MAHDGYTALSPDADAGSDMKLDVADSNNNTSDKGDADVMAPRLEAFRADTLKHFPNYLQEIYSDSLVLNFQVLHWYLRELQYIFWFRIIFVFTFYSVPFTVVSFLTWSDLLDTSTANVVELLLVSYYTGPIFVRAYSECKALRHYIPLWRLVPLQIDCPLVVGIYFASTSTANASKRELISFLTGIGTAIPSLVLWMYFVFKGYTHYAFGFIDKYNHIPPLLREDHNLEVKGLKDRVKTLTDVQRLRLRKGFTSFRSKQ